MSDIPGNEPLDQELMRRLDDALAAAHEAHHVLMDEALPEEDRRIGAYAGLVTALEEGLRLVNTIVAAATASRGAADPAVADVASQAASCEGSKCAIQQALGQLASVGSVANRLPGLLQAARGLLG